MNQHDARYELARAHELLSSLPQLLRAVGMAGAEADDLALDARAVATRLRALREEHAARVTTCASC